MGGEWWEAAVGRILAGLRWEVDPDTYAVVGDAPKATPVRPS